MPQTALPPWNEKADRVVTVAFFDDSDNAVVPTSATYRIDCVKPKISIVPATALTGLSFTKDIVVTAAQNAILSGQAFEQHVLTVEYEYGAPAKHGNGDYFFTLRNMPGVL